MNDWAELEPDAATASPASAIVVRNVPESTPMTKRKTKNDITTMIM